MTNRLLEGSLPTETQISRPPRKTPIAGLALAVCCGIGRATQRIIPLVAGVAACEPEIVKKVDLGCETEPEGPKVPALKDAELRLNLFRVKFQIDFDKDCQAPVEVRLFGKVKVLKPGETIPTDGGARELGKTTLQTPGDVEMFVTLPPDVQLLDGIFFKMKDQNNKERESAPFDLR